MADDYQAPAAAALQMFGVEPDADRARIAALRRQQLAGLMGGVSDVPGVQRMSQAMYQDASRQMQPESEFDRLMKVLTFQSMDQARRGQLEQRAEDRASREEIARANAGLRAMTQQDMIDRRREASERRTYEDAQQFEKRMGDPFWDLVSAVDGARAELAQHGQGKDGSVDLPGFGAVERYLPGVLVGEKGRNLRSRIQTIENLVLRAQSGAAVTPQEAQRLAEQLQTAKGAPSEREMLGALNELSRTLDTALKRNLSIQRPEVRELWERQGQRTGVDPVYQFREDARPPQPSPDAVWDAQAGAWRRGSP